VPESAIRFAVSDGVNRASSWKCWTRRGTGKSDVYLANRQLGDVLKVSLHQSGQWHTAFLQEYLDKHAASGEFENNRFIDTWTVQEVSAGVRIALRIVTPTGAVNIPAAPEKKVVLVAPAPVGKAIEVKILITEPTVSVEPPAFITVIGQFELENGATARVVSSESEMHAGTATMNRTRYFDGASRADITGEGQRALLFGHNEQDGSRVIYDLGRLRVEKVDAPQLTPQSKAE
jgi:hypothetical protein